MNAELTNYIFTVIPFAIRLALLSVPILLFFGWIISIVVAFKSEKGEGLRGFLIFPLTNPFALCALLFRAPKAAAVPAICYLLAVLAVPVAGTFSKQSERAKTSALVERMKGNGDSLELSGFVPDPQLADQNIWTHPFMEPLATAGTYDAPGAEARERIASANEGSPYRHIKPPVPVRGLRYEPAPDERPFDSAAHKEHPFGKLHAASLAVLHDSDDGLTPEGLPKDWAAVGRLLQSYYQQSEASTAQLEEALQRPVDQYPHQVEKAFAMLLPHLSHLKSFSQSTTQRASAAAMAGNGDEAFRLVRLGLKLVDTGDSDLLISRLVQMSQAQILMNAMRVLSQCHVGTEEQWAALDAGLAQWDFPSSIPNALRAERNFGASTFIPYFDRDVFSLTRQINALDGSLPTDDALGKTAIETAARGVMKMWFNSSAQAILIRNWRLAMIAYGEMIDNTEVALQQTSAEPWSDCLVQPLSQPIMNYGILAKMTLPALEKAFDKAVETQHIVALARVAIALERHFIRQGEYPETLAAMDSSLLPYDGVDPMSGVPWAYERSETRGYLLYSIGRNGIDEDGIYQPSNRPPNAASDDRAWFVSPELPAIPRVSHRDLPDPEDHELPESMQERYGLQPPGAAQ